LRIISKYILREFYKIFFLSSISFISLYLIVDFFEKIKSFISHKASINLVSLFFLYKIPFILFHIIPIAVLLSTLLTFTILSRNQEIVAMKASGINLSSICAPILISSFLISFLLFILNESVIPYATKKSEYIENVCIKKKQPAGFYKQNQIWYKSQNAIYNIQIFDPKNNVLKGITINNLDKDFNLVRRIDAKEARWSTKGWIFYDVRIRSWQEDGFFKSQSFSKKMISLPETPQDFKKAEGNPEEMTFSELLEYIKKIESEGYDATKYVVDLHLKISFPLVSLIMAILGIPFALKAERGGGIALSIGTSIFIGFVYYFIYAFSRSLGHSGILPPIISAWLTNILFGIIGVFFLTSAPQ